MSAEGFAGEVGTPTVISPGSAVTIRQILPPTRFDFAGLYAGYPIEIVVARSLVLDCERATIMATVDGSDIIEVALDLSLRTERAAGEWVSHPLPGMTFGAKGKWFCEVPKLLLGSPLEVRLTARRMSITGAAIVTLCVDAALRRVVDRATRRADTEKPWPR